MLCYIYSVKLFIQLLFLLKIIKKYVILSNDNFENIFWYHYRHNMVIVVTNFDDEVYRYLYMLET